MHGSRFSSSSMEQYRPSELRFTHNSIKTDFQDGNSLEETLESIVSGDLSVSDMQPMLVMLYQGRPYVVYGNRRLVLYQMLEKHGHISTVEVKEVAFDRQLFEKMHTTKNEGRSVQFRGSNTSQVNSRLDAICRQQTRTVSYDMMWDSDLEEDSPSSPRESTATFEPPPAPRHRVAAPPRPEAPGGLGFWEAAAGVAAAAVLLGAFLFNRD